MLVYFPIDPFPVTATCPRHGVCIHTLFFYALNIKNDTITFSAVCNKCYDEDPVNTQSLLYMFTKQEWLSMLAKYSNEQRDNWNRPNNLERFYIANIGFYTSQALPR